MSKKDLRKPEDGMHELSEFELVSCNDLHKVIQAAPNKTCGLDVLPTWLLKQSLPCFIPDLCKIVNVFYATIEFTEDDEGLSQ